MTLFGTAARLTVIVDENDMWHHKPIYTEIVRRAHESGLAGASVFRGIEGFGHSRHVHTSRILSLAENLPVMVVVFDSPQRIREFASQLTDLNIHGIITIDEVEGFNITLNK